MPGIFTAYEPVFRRAIHIVMTVTGLLLIAGLWELDLFAMAQHSLLGIGIVLLAAYMLWGITAAAIDRRLQSEGKQLDGVPATRLRTLLPILRATSLVTIVLMAGMSILAALGVDILPLLAGHGAPYEQRVGRAPYGVRQDHPRVPRRRSQVRAPCGDR